MMDLYQETTDLARTLAEKRLGELDTVTARNLATRLRQVLNAHAHRYYVLDAPQITDPEYDRLYRALVEIEIRFP